MTESEANLQANLLRINAEVDAALDAWSQDRSKSRALNDVLETGVVAGKLESIFVITKSIRETLDK